MRFQGDEFSKKIEQGLPASSILEQVLERYKDEMIDCEGSLGTAIYEYFSSPQSYEKDNILLIQYHKTLSMWKKLLEYGIEIKEFNDVDPEAVIDTLVFAYQGVRLYSNLMPIDQKIPEHIISQIKKLLLP